MPKLIEVILSLAFTYLLISLFVGILQELLANLFKLRHRHLIVFLERALGTPDIARAVLASVQANALVGKAQDITHISGAEFARAIASIDRLASVLPQLLKRPQIMEAFTGSTERALWNAATQSLTGMSPEALAGAKAHVVVMLGDPAPDRPQMAELLDSYPSSYSPPYTLGVVQ